MATPPFRRKLAAIFSTDVKGYSRLMQDDEEATVRTIKAYRQLISSIVEKYRGRVVDSPGDNLLAEFASVVDAARSAVEVQRELGRRNESLPEGRRMEFRIGINLGDVIEDDGRIYGDGVNIAARIEGLADPGGICVSESAYHHLRNRLPQPIALLGSFEAKNIAEPVRVYRVELKGREGLGAPSESGAAQPRGRRQLPLVMLGVAILAAVLWVWSQARREEAPPQEPLGGDERASRPKEPSIAVLPLQNLSQDPAQEYLSDGITNDIITDLSHFKDLVVIASNSIFVYKGKPVDIRQVGRDLGVRYVLEGSVQKAGNSLRLNVQLIESANGHHLWAQRYDKSLKDVLAIQNEIVGTIVATLAIQIRAAEQDLAMSKDIGDLGAYDYLMRGWKELSYRTCESNAAARELFERAAALDLSSSRTVSAVAQTYLADFWYGCTEFPDRVLEQAQLLSEQALKINPANPVAHRNLGEIHARFRRYHLALEELRRALELNPNDAESYATLGSVLLYSGRTEDGIQALDKTKRLDPNMSRGSYMNLGLAYYLEGRFGEAIGVLTRGLVLHPEFVGNHIAIAACYARNGQAQEAAQAAEKVRRLHPFFSVDDFGSVFEVKAHRESIREGLRQAGLQ